MKTPRKDSDKTMRIDIDPTTVEQAAAAVFQQPPSPRRPILQTWRAHHLHRDTPFYKLLESVYDAALITTRQGKIIECNERTADFFAMERKAMAGLEIISLISGATPALIDTINKNLESKKYTLVEARCKRADGTSFAAEIAINQVDLDAQGQLCVFVRDITIRRQEQQALEDAVERLQAHDRARMEFVSNVSHELRTPLTSMIYAVNNMLRGVVGPMPEKAINYLERLQSDCHRLLATINDILDLRQIENNTLVLTKTVAPLGQIVRDGADTLLVQADSKHITVDYQIGARELFCWCDTQKIERVILNIVGNAIKFTPPDGTITISLTQDPERPRQALITVNDTGSGIPEEKLPKLSQRYFRLGDHVSGTGLGLAISREIIELHNGSISFASPVPGTDRGTAVYVRLPLAPNPHVLAVSSHPETRALFQQDIADLGYRLTCYDTPTAAVHAAQEKLPAVLIIDHGVPEPELRDCILQLREHPKTKRLPVIILGPGALPPSEVDLYRHFGIFYSTLPWRKAQLAKNLAMAVSGKLR